MDDTELVRLNARQRVANLVLEGMMVANPNTIAPVPADSETPNEIMFRGNATMSGYLRNPDATRAVFAYGWFHTGDLAVLEPDGYARITDRAKDVIISGDENISSLEVEEVLSRQPRSRHRGCRGQVRRAMGEVPCALVEPVEGQAPSASELWDFCRERLARYKMPKAFAFGIVPKTATGKIPKSRLRQMVAGAATT